MTNHSTLVKFKRVREGINLPRYRTLGSAGMDIEAGEDIVLMPMVPTKVNTGLAMELSHDMEAQVRSRSGLSLKGVVVFNSPGTVDSDYRGEVGVVLMNYNINTPYKISKGDRIAQMVFNRLPKVIVLDCATLYASERGSGGFGSTGE